MPDLFSDPITWLLLAAITVTAIIAGLVRHEPRWGIALTIIGASAFVLGLFWAGRLGAEASYAALLATGGFALWETATALTRRTHARAARE